MYIVLDVNIGNLIVKGCHKANEKVSILTSRLDANVVHECLAKHNVRSGICLFKRTYIILFMIGADLYLSGKLSEEEFMFDEDRKD